MKTNFPELIEREQQQFIYFPFKVGRERFRDSHKTDHHREKIVSECLRRNKGFTVKPYCSMQMDLYKNNLTAEQHIMCVHLKTYSNHQRPKYQYFPFHITSDFSHYLGAGDCCEVGYFLTRDPAATRNLTLRVTQKLDTFNSYLLTFSQYFNVTIKYWPPRIQE